MKARKAARTAAAITIAAAFATLSACAKSGGLTTRAPSSRATAASVLRLGETFTTTLGNRVTAYAFERGRQRAPTASPAQAPVAAEVEICAGPTPSERTGARPQVFFIEDRDEVAYPAIAPSKMPALRVVLLEPGECERGWVTFAIPSAAQPVYVVFISSRQVAKWQIG